MAYPHLEPATLDDIPQLCELLQLLFAQEADFEPDAVRQEAGLRQIIAQPERGCILVLREGPLVVGMVNLLFTVSTALGGRVALLEDAIVRPEHRGSGLGTLLLQGAIDCARKNDCLRITLLTDRDNYSAQKFYAHLGFVRSQMLPMRLLFD